MSSNLHSVVIWGDSLARGVVYDEAKGRYVLARKSAAGMVAETLGIDVTNRARMGMTTPAGLEMVQKDLARGIRADAAVIEFGGNDCDFNWKEISDAPGGTHDPRTPAKTFEFSMHEIIRSAQNAGMEPILVNLPPINADRYFSFISSHGLSKENILSWLGDTNHIYRFHERYSTIVNRIARDCKCRLIDIRSAFLEIWNTSSLFCSDGIHPTDDGQELIGKIILGSI